MMTKNKQYLCVFLLLFSVAWSGCSVKSYPAESIKESLSEICRLEYGIEEIDVKIDGDTIGVYLPLEKLFSADFKGSVVAGKVRNLENIFEPSPEALDQVEDVLFSISRVLLSTDKAFKFYILQATDVENTGLQLILKGYVDDVKRVRIWDISRDEYRKRVIHEMKQNRAVLWHKPVRNFFKDLGVKSLQDVQEAYFGKTVTLEALEEVFFENFVPETVADGVKPQWHVESMRSARVQRGEVLIYVRVKPMVGNENLLPTKEFAEYLFLVTYKSEQPRILRVIPFQYLDGDKQLQKIPFPQDIQIERSLESWEEEFPVVDIKVGDFLATQLTRRIQELVSKDERILNTFRKVNLDVEFEENEKESYFVFNFDSLILRDPDVASLESIANHEDVIYLLNLISRDFVDVLRSYHFGDYNYLSLNFVDHPDHHMIASDDMELFRKKKVDFRGLLTPAAI